MARRCLSPLCFTGAGRCLVPGPGQGMTLDARLASPPSALPPVAEAHSPALPSVPVHSSSVLPPVPAPHFRLRVRRSGRGGGDSRRGVAGPPVIPGVQAVAGRRRGEVDVLGLPGDRRAVHLWWNTDVRDSELELHTSLEAARHAGRQFSRSMGGERIDTSPENGYRYVPRSGVRRGGGDASAPDRGRDNARPGQAGDIMSAVSSDVTPIAARLLLAYEEAGRSGHCLVILLEGSAPAEGIEVIRGRGALVVEVPPGTDVQAVLPHVEARAVRLPPLPEVGPVTLPRVATDDP